MHFRFKPSVEKGTAATNNGHVVRRLELFLDDPVEPEDFELSGGFSGDGEVGYINVTYITEESWERLYTGDSGLLRWLNDFQGAHFKPEKHSLEKTVKLLSQKCENWHDWLSDDEVEEMSQEELEVRFDSYTSELWEKHRTEHENTRKFHVGKPRVEFVRVKERFQRNGYGTALYRRITEILQERYGLCLYSTNLQSESAVATWEHLLEAEWSEVEEVEVPFDKDLPGCDNTRYELSVKPETKLAA
jgi:GNAT superfamily N-acetyltransferase